jgi:hypothetical protein
MSGLESDQTIKLPSSSSKGIYFFMGGSFWLSNADPFCLSCILCILTLLLVPLAGLHFCVGLDFVTPSL